MQIVFRSLMLRSLNPLFSSWSVPTLKWEAKLNSEVLDITKSGISALQHASLLNLSNMVYWNASFFVMNGLCRDGNVIRRNLVCMHPIGDIINSNLQRTGSRHRYTFARRSLRSLPSLLPHAHKSLLFINIVKKCNLLHFVKSRFLCQVRRSDNFLHPKKKSAQNALVI